MLQHIYSVIVTTAIQTIKSISRQENNFIPKDKES